MWPELFPFVFCISMFVTFRIKMNPVGNYPWHFHGALDGRTWEVTWLWRRADSHQDVEKIFSCSCFMHSMKGNVVWTCLIHLWEVKLDQSCS